MAQLTRRNSGNPLVPMWVTRFGQNAHFCSFTVLVTKKHQKSKKFCINKISKISAFSGKKNHSKIFNRSKVMAIWILIDGPLVSYGRLHHIYIYIYIWLANGQTCLGHVREVVSDIYIYIYEKSRHRSALN